MNGVSASYWLFTEILTSEISSCEDEGGIHGSGGFGCNVLTEIGIEVRNSQYLMIVHLLCYLDVAPERGCLKLYARTVGGDIKTNYPQHCRP